MSQTTLMTQDSLKQQGRTKAVIQILKIFLLGLVYKLSYQSNRKSSHLEKTHRTFKTEFILLLNDFVEKQDISK